MQPFRLLLRTAATDLHSGITGGVVRNPLTELMQVVASCVDGRTGNVLIPGFYDEVEGLSPTEERAFLDSGFSVETFQRDHHVTSLRETRPLEVMRRLWATPTFEVHGVVGGYTGPGVKAAIPPRAEVSPVWTHSKAAPRDRWPMRSVPPIGSASALTPSSLARVAPSARCQPWSGCSVRRWCF
jgi:hypothetical protein